MTLTVTLTPSELVYFYGDKFASKVMMGNHELVHNSTKVSINQLGEAILMAALLTDADKGILSLEMKTSKALFGMMTTHAVQVNIINANNDWPENTLESMICQIAERLNKTKGTNAVTVEDLMYNFFSEDVDWPQKSIISFLLGGLYKRGLLLNNEKQKYVPYPDTLKLIEQQSVEGVQKLIDSSKNKNPELHALVIKQIQSGLKKRLKQDSDFGGDD